MVLTAQNRRNRRETRLSASWYTINPKWTGLEVISGVRDEKPSNRLSCGSAATFGCWTKVVLRNRCQSNSDCATQLQYVSQICHQCFQTSSKPREVALHTRPGNMNSDEYRKQLSSGQHCRFVSGKSEVQISVHGPDILSQAFLGFPNSSKDLSSGHDSFLPFPIHY